MAIEKTIDINVNAKDAVKDITLLNSILEEQEQITIELQREQQKLEQQLRDTPKNSLAAQKQLNTQLNHVKDSIKDQNLSVKELKVQQNSLSSSSQDLTSDLVSNGGAMGILNNLTGGLAQQFKDSYEAISLSSKGLSGFKKAMVATGIGAFVILVGALVANWDKVKDALSGASEESKAYKEAQDDIVSAVSKVQKSITKMDNVFEQAKNGTISKDEALKQYNESLGESVGYATSLSEAEGLLVSNAAIVIETTKLKAQAEVLYAKAAEARAKVIAGDESLDPSFWQKIKINIAGVGGVASQAIAKNLEYAKNVNESINTAKKLESSAADIQTKISKLQEGLKKGSLSPKDIKSSNDKIKNLEDERLKQEEERINKLNDLKSRIRDESANKEDEARALELQKIREHNKALMAEALANGLLSQELIDSLNEKETAKQAEFDAIDKERRDKRKAEEDAIKTKASEERIKETNEKIELDNKVKDAKVGIAKNTLSLISEVAGEGSKIGKGVALAQATISGIEGVQNAYTTAQKSPVTAVFPAYPIIQAGLAGAFSAMQLKKIASTNPSKGSAAGGGASVGGGAPQPPAFNIVGASETNQLADAIGTQEQQPVQAYVVSNDVTTAQSLQNNIIEGATIG
jgi:hypothetical protein